MTRPTHFAELFERHAVRLHHYLSKRVGPVDAEDLVGETFATAFRNRGKFDARYRDARPWLFGIATNLAHHYWRSEARRLERDTRAAPSTTSTDDPGEHATSRAFFESQLHPIASALGQLPDDQLDVVLLTAGPGLTYEEISQALGIPVGTVRSRLSRARQHLKAVLGDSRHYFGGPIGDEHPDLDTREGSR
jgi:RNA polymerase sigma-70 factor (ECF subfamily)